MTWFYLTEFGARLGTARFRNGTARAEPATRRRVGGRRDVSLEDGPFALRIRNRVRDGNRGKQRPRVRVQGRGMQFIAGG